MHSPSVRYLVRPFLRKCSLLYTISSHICRAIGYFLLQNLTFIAYIFHFLCIYFNSQFERKRKKNTQTRNVFVLCHYIDLTTLCTFGRCCAPHKQYVMWCFVAFPHHFRPVLLCHSIK